MRSQGRRLRFSIESIVYSNPRGVKSLRNEFPVPRGRIASATRSSVRDCGNKPFRSSYDVPSPPTARKFRKPRSKAARASSEPSPARVVRATSRSTLVWRTRLRAESAIRPHRPPPAAGFTTAKKRGLTTKCPRTSVPKRMSQGCHRVAAQFLPNLFRQLSALNFERRGARKIFVPQRVTAYTFKIWKPPVASGYILLCLRRELPVWV